MRAARTADNPIGSPYGWHRLPGVSPQRFIAAAGSRYCMVRTILLSYYLVNPFLLAGLWPRLSSLLTAWPELYTRVPALSSTLLPYLVDAVVAASTTRTLRLFRFTVQLIFPIESIVISYCYQVSAFSIPSIDSHRVLALPVYLPGMVQSIYPPIPARSPSSPGPFLSRSWPLPSIDSGPVRLYPCPACPWPCPGPCPATAGLRPSLRSQSGLRSSI